MIVLVCGDREWNDRETIAERLKVLPPNTVILEGGCRGVDLLAKEIAINLGLAVREFPANWALHGKAAGPRRNRAMLDEHPNLVLAFHSNLAKSKGTKDTINEAKRRGIPVELIE